MPKLVISGATLSCSMGTTPAKLSVLPMNGIDGVDQPMADVRCHLPQLNVPPFGMCTSPSNPQVAAATAAALGVLTPQPCLPVLASPWTPGSPVIEVRGAAALTDDSQCACAYAGQITVLDPGQTQLETKQG